MIGSVIINNNDVNYASNKFDDILQNKTNFTLKNIALESKKIKPWATTTIILPIINYIYLIKNTQ